MTQCNHTTNQRTFKHLSAIQRGKLFQMVQEKKYTQSQMAQMLGVNQSTISRELKRGRVQQRNTNWEYYTVYLPDYAQIRYQQNRQKCRIAPGLEKYDPLFWKELTFELKKKPKDRLYSVDTFIAFFKKKHPLRKVPCTKTVYRMIEQGWTEIKSFFFAEKFNEYRRKSLENICSEEGIEERINRSIQAEGVFSKLKTGLNYHRFPCKGLQNIKAEIDLLALALNVNTLVAKIQRADFKPTRYIIKQAS